MSLVFPAALAWIAFGCGKTEPVGTPVGAIPAPVVPGVPPVAPPPGGVQSGTFSTAIVFPADYDPRAQVYRAPILHSSNLAQYPGMNTGIYLRPGDIVRFEGSGRWGYYNVSGDIFISYNKNCGAYSFTSNFKGAVGNHVFDLGNGMAINVGAAGNLHIGFEADLSKYDRTTREGPCLSSYSGYLIVTRY